MLPVSSAANQTRTGDLILTKDAHYHLCYSSKRHYEILAKSSPVVKDLCPPEILCLRLPGTQCLSFSFLLSAPAVPSLP